MTLLEVLVSILIFSIGLLGTVALHARAVQYSTNAEDRSRAALMADDLAALMWARGTVDLNQATEVGPWDDRWTEPDALGNLPALPGATGTSVVNTVDGVRVATITIQWRAGTGAGETSQLVTQVVIP